MVEAKMKKLTKLYFYYLIFLPFIGTLATVYYDTNSYTTRIGGFIPAVVLLAILAEKFQVPDSPFKLVLTIFLVPFEILLHIYFFNGNIWEFFLETAFIELFTLILALVITMMVFRPSGWFGVIFGTLWLIIVAVGYGMPLYRIYINGNYHFTWWIILGVIILSGFWTHLQMFFPEAMIFAETKPSWAVKLGIEDTNSYTKSPIDLNDNFFIIIVYVFSWIIIFWTPIASLFF